MDDMSVLDHLRSELGRLRIQGPPPVLAIRMTESQLIILSADLRRELETTPRTSGNPKMTSYMGVPIVTVPDS